MTFISGNIINRIGWIDWAKFFCISCVVLGHSKCPELNTIIYGYHMPLFFILSGYLYKSHDWKKTMLSFIVPIVVFSAFTFAMALPFELVHHKPILDYFGSVTFFAYRFSQQGNLFVGLWFIETLFVIRLLMGDLRLFSVLRKYHLWLAILCILASIVIEIYNIRCDLYCLRSIECFPFFSFGIWLKERGIMNRNFHSYLLLLLMAIHICISYVNGNCDISENVYGINYLIFYANALLGSFVIMHLCKYGKNNDCILTCSIGTLAILGTHSTIIRYVWAATTSTIWCPIISLPLSLLLGYIIIKISLRFFPILIGKTGVCNK